MLQSAQSNHLAIRAINLQSAKQSRSIIFHPPHSNPEHSEQSTYNPEQSLQARLNPLLLQNLMISPRKCQLSAKWPSRFPKSVPRGFWLFYQPPDGGRRLFFSVPPPLPRCTQCRVFSRFAYVWRSSGFDSLYPAYFIPWRYKRCWNFKSIDKNEKTEKRFCRFI